MLGVSVGKLETALGRVDAPAAKESRDVVLLRRAEELMEELREGDYGFLQVEIDKVCLKKRVDAVAAEALMPLQPAAQPGVMEFATPEEGGGGVPKKRSRVAFSGAVKSWWTGPCPVGPHVEPLPLLMGWRVSKVVLLGHDSLVLFI